MAPSVTLTSRRQVLKLLAGSPLFAGAALPALLQARGLQDGVIPTLDEMFQIMDFRDVAEQMLLPQHWAYLATGVDDDATLRANREGFTKYQLRMRRLVDFSDLDMSTELFGVRWDTPIGFSPVASLKGFHTDGEPAVARSAQASGTLQMLSNQTSTGVEEVNEARGEPVWYQIYVRPDWENTLKIVKRVEAAGCPVLVFTIDLLGGRNTVTSDRAQGPEGTRAEFCQNCHKDLTKPMAAGLTRPAQGQIFRRLPPGGRAGRPGLGSHLYDFRHVNRSQVVLSGDGHDDHHSGRVGGCGTRLPRRRGGGHHHGAGQGDRLPGRRHDRASA